jgi:hypothetical protein
MFKKHQSTSPLSPGTLAMIFSSERPKIASASHSRKTPAKPFLSNQALVEELSPPFGKSDIRLMALCDSIFLSRPWKVHRSNCPLEWSHSYNETVNRK